jgi:hypothetical protein
MRRKEEKNRAWKRKGYFDISIRGGVLWGLGGRR